jgi:cytosine deaminase
VARSTLATNPRRRASPDLKPPATKDLETTRIAAERALIIERALLPSGELCDVHVRDGRIVDGGSTHLQAAARVVKADGRLTLPGLVNVHTHLDKASLASRVTNESGTVEEARQRMKEAKLLFTVADIRERAEAVLKRLVADGVTAVRTHVDVDTIVGLKGVEALLSLRESMAHLITLQIVAFPQEGIQEHPGTEDLMKEALVMGVDVVGGHLSIGDTLRQQTDTVFRLARAFDRDIDAHVDHNIDRDYTTLREHEDGKRYPDNLGVVYLAEKTIREDYQGRVTASHLCGLDSVPPGPRDDVIALLQRANVSVIALPISNMYTHGRHDPVGSRRGVTRLLELQAGGVRVAVGTDNIRDAFDPFASGDLVQNAIFSCLACHSVSVDDFRSMMRLETSEAADVIGLDKYGQTPGCDADGVVFEARSWDALLDGETGRACVFKRGTIVATTEVTKNVYFERSA